MRRDDVPGISEEQAEHLMGAERGHVASGSQQAAGLRITETGPATMGGAGDTNGAGSFDDGPINGDLFSGDGLPVWGGPVNAAGGGGGHRFRRKGAGQAGPC